MNSRLTSTRFWKTFLLSTVLTLLIAGDVFAQVYQATLRQRRYGDQLHVEVWMRSLSTSAPKLGESSLVIQYNSSFLTPAATQAPATSDTIQYDVDQATPPVTITSGFDNANGYQTLVTQNYGSGFYSLEVRKASGGTTGLVPAATGRGSFIGKMIFDITTTGLQDNSLSLVQWSASTLPGDVVIYDYNDTDIESSVTMTNPGDFTIRGITILNPNGPSEVVDRDKVYASIATGYPVYFERSGTLTSGQYGTGGTQGAYLFEYSLDGGTSWVTIGRAMENNGTAPTGDIHSTGPLTSAGAALSTNGRDIIRVVWSADANFAQRTETARLRITQLATTGALATRTTLVPSDVSDANFVLGRLFFAQLNGSNQYLKSPGNYNNATQLTVEAWVNLNAYNDVGSSPAVVATSGGPSAGQEGAWMLYLKDGRYPAFRAREISGRGTNGYIADLVSTVALPTTGSVTLGAAHGNNWNHLAATVSNGTVTLYVNGNLVASYNNTTAPNIRMLTTNHPVWVGVNPNGTIDSSDYLNAGVKGIMVWRTALTQSQIRTLVSGVPNVTNVGTTPGDADFFKRTFELYYTLEGTRADAATDATYQGGAQNADYYSAGALANASVRFRPDQPHIKVTSPSGCDGITNLTGNNVTVRWIAYGVGDNSASGRDLEVQVSTDGGTTWTYARNAGGTAAGNDLGGAAGAIVNVESAEATWLPFNNEGTATQGQGPCNLRSIASSYAKNVVLRIRGFNASTQGVTSMTESFVVAPYFSFARTASTKVEIPGSTSLNITGQTMMLEGWVRPYRFPTAGEVRFPIISKLDTATGKPHYSLSLLPSGQLEFRLTTASGAVRTAVSSAAVGNTLVTPNSIELDSPWTHVAAWVNIGNGTGASEIRFYIDGNVQRETAISTQLGDSITLNVINENPTYLGGEIVGGVNYGFVGELRDLRIWNGTPGGVLTTGNEPTALTTRIQGAMNVPGSTLNGGAEANLTASWNMSTGLFNSSTTSAKQTVIESSVGSITANVSGSGACYSAIRPVLKFVEPYFNQRIRNTTTNATLRWCGFYYDGSATGFVTGNTVGPVNASVEYSLQGGGGIVVQPYQYVASDAYDAGYSDALTLGAPQNFTLHSGSNMRFGGTLNLTTTDPDLNDDGTFSDQGRIAAALTNARLRVTNTYTINTTASTVQAQTPLFTITPASNFTVRALFEGRNQGVGGTFSSLPTTYSGGGARVKLYKNSGGVPGALVATAESEFGYDANAFSTGATGAVDNRGTNTGDGEFYATIPFVFTDLADGNYWVVLEQMNHLPVMSRTPAPFLYAGDDVTTTAIESGWDFALWNGTDNDASYAAFGSRLNTSTNTGYSTTGLNFNEGSDGYTGVSANYLAGVVAGDVVRDGQVNASDRVRVRGDAGTALVRSDITGDGNVNGTDRDVVDRNFGKVSSIYNVTFPIIGNGGGNPSGLIAGNTPVNPFTFVSPENVELSQFMLAQAREAEVVPPLALKTVNGLQGGYSYSVTAEPTRTGNFIDVPMYIQNNGAAFGMGNATFALDFNPKRLKFSGLTGTDKVVYTNKPARGYSNMYSAPRSDADRALDGVRTIEIDYDAFSRRGGEQVTNTKTYLGTLRFEIIGAPGSIGFKWHSSSAISGAQGESLMPYGDFKKIPGIMMYSASITAPTTGSRVGVGRTCNVQWTATGTSNVFVEISTDNGATWKRVQDKAVATSANALGFTAPATLASDCYVRLVDEETGDEVTRSKKFALVNISASVNRPAVSDPIYLGGTNDIIRWASQGLTNVSFEFSSDNGTTWANATATQNATTSSTGWKIPSVNSANCIVRMNDEETKTEVSRSGSFRVLAGTLSFLNPNNGERFKPGVTTRLRWRTASSVNLVDLQISLDGGNTWALLQSNVDGKKQFMDWVIPTVNSNNVVIRAIYPGMEELEYSRTPAFRIDGPVSVETTDEDGFYFGAIAPNPATSFANVDFSIPTNSTVHIVVYNELGEKVATIANGVEYTSGTHTVVLSADALPQGAYLVQFTVGTRSVTRKVVVVK